MANFERDKTIEKFGKKYPQFIRQSKINYPIEDMLLFIDPDFHQISLVDLPVPVVCKYPQDSFLDILSITNFFYTFSEHISVSPFNIDQLYFELSKNNDSHLLKEIVMAITKELVVHILSKENLDEQLSGQNKFLYSASKLSNIFNIIDFLPYSWLTLLSEIMTSNTFKEYLEETAVETILQKLEESPIETNFFLYSLNEKVSCITFLISCFCDTKVFHEALSERIEQRAELSREKAMIKTQIKELEQKQASEIKTASVTRKATLLSEKISKLQQKVSDLSQKIENIQVRITPIGLDRNYNEYYIFKFDMKKLYMLKPLENTWHYFDKKEEVEALMQALCTRGIRESKLLENLKSKFSTLTFSEAKEENLPEGYTNKLSEFKNIEGDLNSVKKLLLDTEKKFTKYLNKSNKQ